MNNLFSKQIHLYELKEFYHRWNIKCNSYDNQILSDLFDKFFSLFVIYNRLYNEVTALFEINGTLDQMREEGIIDKKPKRVRDNKAATVCVAKFLHDTSPTINLLMKKLHLL